MKLHYIIIFWVIMVCVMPLNGQNYLKRKVSIEVDNQPINTILNTLEDSLDFNFSYEALLINENETATLHFQKAPLKKVLNHLFNHSCNYKVVGTHVIIQSKIAPEDDKGNVYDISGQVLGPDGKPLENAIVYEANRHTTAITNNDGYYNFSFRNNQPVALNISRKGYQDTMVFVNRQKKAVNVRIIPLPPQRVAGSDFKPIDNKITASVPLLKKDHLSDIKLVKLMVSDEALYVTDQLNVFNWQAAQISLVPYVGTNELLDGSTSNNFSLNLIAGYTAEIKGFEAGAVGNIIQGSVYGFQAAGVSNVVGENVHGFQAAGIANTTFKNIHGFQSAGIINTSLGNIHGVQTAGIINRTKGHLNGLQIAGIMNICEGKDNEDNRRGLNAQLAGVINSQKNDTTNLQIAMAINRADNLEGAQLGVYSNIVKETAKGIQIARFNHCKTLDGLQIGLINRADTIRHGFQIGLWNMLKTGYHTVDLSTDETFYFNAAYKTGGQHFYSFLKIGIGDYFAAGYGLGYTTNFRKKFSFNADLYTSAILSFDDENDTYLGTLSRLQLGLNFKVTPRITCSFGPSINHFGYNKEDDIKTPSKRHRKHDVYFGSYHVDQGVVQQKNRNWIGWNLGIRF